MHSRRVIILFTLALGCRSVSSDSPATPDTGATAAANVARLPNGLAQRVTLSPAVLHWKQNVEIRSVLRNEGTSAFSLSSRMCGLDFSGTLKLTWPPDIGKCAGYSMEGNIAPGDTVGGGDLMRVDSPPGEYTLRVRHALEPELWFELKVRVIAP